MLTLTSLFVAARLIANPLSNVFQKQLTRRAADPLFVIAATHALLTLACLPLLAVAPPAAPAPLGAGFWASILGAALLAVAGNALLVAALRSTDLSVLGPINAYKSVLSLALGFFMLGEVPTPAGAGGILLVVAGSYFVVDREAGQARRTALARFARDPGVRLRFAALALSATEAVVLKKALLLSSPATTFVLWCALGVPIAAAAVWLRLGPARVRGELAILRGSLGTYALLAATTGLMQLTTRLTFGTLQVGSSLALFQLSTLVSLLLGWRYFQQPNIGKRLLGSAIMVAGACLIVAFGRAG